MVFRNSFFKSHFLQGSSTFHRPIYVLNQEKKMKKKLSILAVTIVSGLLICQLALAANTVTSTGTGAGMVSNYSSKSSIGLGVGLVPDYEGSDNYTFVPLLYGRYSYGDGAYLQLQGAELKWNMLSDKVEFGPLLQYRRSRNDVESNRVEKMDKVDAAVAAGAFLTGRSTTGVQPSNLPQMSRVKIQDLLSPLVVITWQKYQKN